MTVRLAIQAAVALLHGSHARRDAERLLSHVLGRERVWLLTHPEAAVSPEQHAAFTALLHRRLAHEPIQYLLGHQEFFGLPFVVTPDVLIPRPETELLVEIVLDWAAEQPPALRLVDVGTGSGAIACALASRLTQAEIWALDISPSALSVARINVARLGFADRIHLVSSNLLAALPATLHPLDVVVSNPPYIPTTDAPCLEPQVLQYEPHTALFAGPDGLELYRRLIPEAWSALRPGGLLALEIGYGQGAAILGLLSAWSSPVLHPDLAGIPRIALAIRP